jgi:hypothetical protein
MTRPTGVERATGRDRAEWFGIRTAHPPRSARFDWEDGSTRVGATFISSGRAKSQVAVEHELLPDAKSAEQMKTFWRERLVALKELLES